MQVGGKASHDAHNVEKVDSISTPATLARGITI